MPPQEIDLNPVTHITIDAIGKPGQRVFYIQAFQGDQATTLIVEKVQVQTMIIGILQFLEELRGAGTTPGEPFCRAWIGADLDNTPSQRGIDRAGFWRVADLLVERGPGLRPMRVEGYPGIPKELVAEARRVFLGHRAPGELKIAKA